MNINLWIDDERVEPRGWLRASDAENAIYILDVYHIVIDKISFDHDIGSSGNGADVASHLEKLAQEQKISSKMEFNIHSKNPGGVIQIRSIIERILTSWNRNKREIEYQSAKDFL